MAIIERIENDQVSAN